MPPAFTETLGCGVQKTPTTTAPRNKNTKATVMNCNSRAKVSSIA
jgi:hypothetical protein